MAKEEPVAKKIIVDEDWKKEAEHEREVLAAKEEEQKKQKSEQAVQQPRGPVPEGNFAGLISMLATQTMFAMGLLQVQGQDPREPDLDLARYNIDMLATLEEKTKGNLSEAEERALKNTLSDLRMGFVQIAQALEKESQ